MCANVPKCEKKRVHYHAQRRFATRPHKSRRLQNEKHPTWNKIQKPNSANFKKNSQSSLSEEANKQHK